MHMGAESRNLEIFKYLADKGDDIHAKDKIHANDIISTIFTTSSHRFTKLSNPFR